MGIPLIGTLGRRGRMMRTGVRSGRRGWWRRSLIDAVERIWRSGSAVLFLMHIRRGYVHLSLADLDFGRGNMDL